MNNTLIFDTETTGLPLWEESHSHPNQGRICQLGCILINEKYEEIAAFSSLIKPEGWTIQEDAFARHGIPQSKCEEFGIPMIQALDIFDSFINKADHVVAHGLRFDSFLIDTELCIRNKGSLPWRYNWNLQGYCTMIKATKPCGLKQNGSNRPKWPKLSEAHEILCGCGFDKAHDALADCSATKRVFIKLKEMGL